MNRCKRGDRLTKSFAQSWLDKLTSTNCIAKQLFRAGQTSLNFNSYLQLIIKINIRAGRTQQQFHVCAKLRHVVRNPKATFRSISKQQTVRHIFIFQSLTFKLKATQHRPTAINKNFVFKKSIRDW